MLKFGDGHIFLRGFMAATKNSANPDIWRKLGRLLLYTAVKFILNEKDVLCCSSAETATLVAAMITVRRVSLSAGGG